MKFTKKKAVICIVLLLPLLLEIFVFNFSAVKGLVTSREETEFTATLSRGIKEWDDGRLQCLNGERCYEELTDFSQNVHSLYVDAGSPDGYVTVEIYGKDEGNARYYLMGTQKIVEGVEESKWIDLHFYGQADSIKISFDVVHNGFFWINEVGVNQAKPLFFHLERVLLIYAVLGILYFLGGKNEKIWGISFEEGCKNKKCIGAVLAVMLMLCIGVAGMVQLNTFSPRGGQIHQELTKAIMDGRLYLDEEPPQYLEEMDNPYDFNQREYLQVRHKDQPEYKWDYAYYNGKYYIYFGILPVLLIYLPVYALTGIMLRTDLVVGMLSILLVGACFWLVREIFSRWFRSGSWLLYPVLATAMFFGTGVTVLMRNPAVYETCIIMGLVSALAGLASWIRAGQGEKLKIRYLLLGSLLIASTAASRPQFLLTMVFGLVLFLPEFVEEKRFRPVKNWKQILSLCIPFVVIAAAVMMYNYVRFQSPFEFGSTYNLTTNDVTHRGWNLARVGNGIYEYLLRPLHVTTQFPFLSFQELETGYVGETVYEPHFGGAIWYNPLIFLIFGGTLFRKKNDSEKKSNPVLKAMVLASVISIVIMIAADANMGGIVERYQSDFLWLLYLVIIICVVTKLNGMKDVEQKASLRNKILIMTLLTIFLNFLLLWIDGIYDVFDNNLDVYTNLKYLFEFWRF